MGQRLILSDQRLIRGGRLNQRNMEIDEKTIQYLEEQIPELAIAATAQAYRQALAAGSSVFVAEGGKIIEVFPDGTSKVVKQIAPFIATEKGEIIEIK